MTTMLQRSPEWYAARLGKVTASRVSSVVAKTKSKGEPSALRKNYMADLLIERLTGVPADSYQTQAMLNGIEREPEARDAYMRELWPFEDCEEVGFIDHPRIKMSGASPDGLIREGLVEIKCCEPAQHIALLDAVASGKTPPIKEAWVKQMQWQMASTDRKTWVDFVSYEPHMPEEMQLYIQRVPYDPAMVAELEDAVVEFLAELDATVARLKAKYQRVAT